MSEQPLRTLVATSAMTDHRDGHNRKARICPACGMPSRGPFCSTCYSPRIVEKRGDTLKAWLPVELEAAVDAAGSGRLASASASSAGTVRPPSERRSEVVPAVAPRTPVPDAVPADDNDGDELSAADTVIGPTVLVSDPVAPNDATADAPVPEIVGDVSSASLQAAAAADHEKHGLPTVDELPAMPDLGDGVVAKPRWRESRKADKLGLEPKELAYQRLLLDRMGISSPSALDAPARAALRLRSTTLAGVGLSAEQTQRVIFESFVEVAAEKHRAHDKEETRDLKEGSAWFLVAGVAHMVLLAAIWSLILIVQPEKKEEKVAGITVAAEPELSPNVAPPAVERLPSDLQINDPVTEEEMPDVEVPDDLRPDPTTPPLPTSQPNPDPPAPPSPLLPKLPDLKLPGTGRRGLDSPHDSAGVPNPGGGMMGTRIGAGKRQALRRHGGSAGTENAVEAGLEWLKRTQLRDGRWEPAENADGRGEYFLAPGYTALALLCYLGAGHVPWQDSGGRYQQTVDRALGYLLETQERDGLFSSRHMGMTYNHGVATLAIAEAYAMTGDDRLRRPLEEALDWMYDAQMPSGGWDYTNVNTADRTDASITGWMVMAMKSALIAGVDVRRDVWDAAHEAILDLTLETGEVYYCRNGTIYPKRRGTGMIGVGLLCRLYWGEGQHDSRRSVEHPETAPPALSKSVQWLRDNPPSYEKLFADDSHWAEMDSAERINLPSDDEYFHTVYYWYYGTLSLYHLTGGEGELWTGWNAHLQDAILPSQNLDESDEDHGSWDAVHPFWGRHAGRLYATCLNILNMEIYYRYLPLYGGDGQARMPGQLVDEGEARRPRVRPGRSYRPGRTPPPRDDDDDGVDVSTEEGAKQAVRDPLLTDRERTEAIRTLRESNSDEARETLGRLLLNPAVSEFTRWTAIKALGEMKADDQYPQFRNAYRMEFNEDLRATILEYAGMLGVEDAFDWLLGVMKSDGASDTALAQGAAKGLAHLTGKNYGPSPGPWESYRFQRTRD